MPLTETLSERHGKYNLLGVATYHGMSEHSHGLAVPVQ
jgi:hypothetical protein